jgi:drug/metabolite transporter (DMT)-like permease
MTAGGHSLDPDSDEPGPSRPASLWLLLVIAAALVWVGVDPAVRREGPELALPAFGLAALCVALFFSAELRELMSRWPWRH